MQSNIFQSINPASNRFLDQQFHSASSDEVHAACEKAQSVFDVFRQSSQQKRAYFLLQIIEELTKQKDEIIKRCHLETALPVGRLTGEFGRTQNQIRMFVSLLEEGSWVEAIIDKPIPDRTPIPRPDLRQMRIPIGPVAIFGASNFPLAFSVAGGDTISALAAGCPVVVKGHPEHPGTSYLVAQAIEKAVLSAQLPEGIFNLLQGVSHEIGSALVQHPAIKAVGFTGSHSGGRALFDLANSRIEPIPVFAEMGSVNPVVIFPEAQKENGISIANGLVESITLGVGQFCTNPGLVFLVKSSSNDFFLNTLIESVKTVESGTMLSPSIANAYTKGIDDLITDSRLSLLGKGLTNNLPNMGVPHLFKMDYADFKSDSKFAEEIFGPVSIIVQLEKKDLLSCFLQGQLTATIHVSNSELENNQELIHSLSYKVGRILLNGFPTGVEVGNAMVHGGPYPATTQGAYTSVGTNAIKRFTRPICYQNFSQEILPAELKDHNPLQILRKVDGLYTRDSF